MSGRHWLISSFIVVILGLQASTFVTGTKIWPFMAYAMYADAKDSVTLFQVEAQLADGRSVPVDQAMIGVKYFAWRDHYLYAFGRGQFDRVPEAVQRIEARTGQRVRRLDLHCVDHRIVAGAVRTEDKTVTLFAESSGP
jgi:hypothetical protein